MNVSSILIIIINSASVYFLFFFFLFLLMILLLSCRSNCCVYLYNHNNNQKNRSLTHSVTQYGPWPWVEDPARVFPRPLPWPLPGAGPSVGLGLWFPWGSDMWNAKSLSKFNNRASRSRIRSYNKSLRSPVVAPGRAAAGRAAAGRAAAGRAAGGRLVSLLFGGGGGMLRCVVNAPNTSSTLLDLKLLKKRQSVRTTQLVKTWARSGS